MSLKLMYITNRPAVASIAERSGVDRIFVDMEALGKELRQGGMDTVKSSHTVSDVAALRGVLHKSELLVRINPIHDAVCDVDSTEEEVARTLEAGADILMLPMAKTPAELARFVRAVDGRAKTVLLLETAEAADRIEEMLAVDGVDEVHIGLNDLHLARGKRFMFELLADGTVEALCEKIRKKNIPYGFGGVARLGCGMLPAEHVIAEHYRLGSTMAILSRSFCNINQMTNEADIAWLFENEVAKIRAFEAEVSRYTEAELLKNKDETAELVAKVAAQMGRA